MKTGLHVLLSALMNARMAELASNLKLALAQKISLAFCAKLPSVILHASMDNACKVKRRTNANVTRDGKEKRAKSTLTSALRYLHVLKTAEIPMDPSNASATPDMCCQTMTRHASTSTNAHQRHMPANIIAITRKVLTHAAAMKDIPLPTIL